MGTSLTWSSTNIPIEEMTQGNSSIQNYMSNRPENRYWTSEEWSKKCKLKQGVTNLTGEVGDTESSQSHLHDSPALLSTFLLYYLINSIAPHWSSSFPSCLRMLNLKTQIWPPLLPCFKYYNPKFLTQPTRPTVLWFPLCCGDTGFLELCAGHKHRE